MRVGEGQGGRRQGVKRCVRTDARKKMEVEKGEYVWSMRDVGCSLHTTHYTLHTTQRHTTLRTLNCWTLFCLALSQNSLPVFPNKPLNTLHATHKTLHTRLPYGGSVKSTIMPWRNAMSLFVNAIF